MIVHALKLALHILIVSFDNRNKFIDSSHLVSLFDECPKHELSFLKDHTERGLIFVEEVYHLVKVTFSKQDLRVKLHEVLR